MRKGIRLEGFRLLGYLGWFGVRRLKGQRFLGFFLCSRLFQSSDIGVKVCGALRADAGLGFR